MIFAVMAKYFPAPSDSSSYCNKPSEFDRVTGADVFSSLVSEELTVKLNQTGKMPLLQL